MGLFHSPKIITDGLVTLLDAGNSKSYPGSGTTWTDLSSNQQDATMNGNPSFSTATGVSHFDLDGDGDYFEIANHVDVSPAVTASCWIQSHTANWNDYGWMMSKRNQFLLHPNSAGSDQDMIWYIHNGSFRSTGTFVSFDITQWHNWTGTYDGTTLKLYRNGELVASNSSSGTLTSSTSSLGIGYDIGLAGTRFGEARIANCMVYNKALTSSEVNQNFEALRGRFNI